MCVYLYMNIIGFLHSSIDRQLGFFDILAIIKNASMNIGMHIALKISVLIFLRFVPRSDC